MSYLRPRWQGWAALGLAAICLGLGSAPLIQAENMRSDSYIIQFGNFNTTSGTKSGGGYTVTDTVGQNAPGQFGLNPTGYRVFSGFQYVYAIPRFNFRILGLDINLGILSPDVFNTATNQLVVSTRSGGYSILAAADHQLRQAGGVMAPDIAHADCGGGCDIDTAAVWNSASEVGFGFNVAGVHRSTDFTNGTYFRPFADRENSQSPQVIAEHNQVVKDDVLTVTYQAAVNGSQAAGTYQTVIDFLAVPNY